MWTIWVNLGYLGEFEKMLRVSQKIGSFWRYRCWAIFDNYYIRMGNFPDIPRDPNRYISKYLLLSFLHDPGPGVLKYRRGSNPRFWNLLLSNRVKSTSWGSPPDYPR